MSRNNTPTKSSTNTKIPTRKNNYAPGPLSQISRVENNHSITYKFRIDGIPRPMYRAFARSHSNGRAHMWNPSQHDVASFKAAVATITTHQPPAFLDGAINPVSLRTILYFPRPKDHYRFHTPSSTLVLRHDAPIYVTKKPDIDNTAKLIMDCLKGPFFHDDASVSSLQAEKIWWAPDSRTFTSGQKNLGFTLIRLTQYKNGTTSPNCPCRICNP